MSRKYRNRPTRDYTVLRNAALRNPAISLKAKGCLALMLTFPDDWEYHLDHLEGMSRDGRDALRGAVRELEAHGYITRQQTRRGDGTMGDAEYFVTDDVPTVDGKTVAGFSVAGKTVAGKPATTKTDSTKTELTKTKKKGGRENFDALKIDLPPNVSPEIWREFVDYRRERRLSITETHTRRLLKKLSAAGADADEMLTQTIENGWQGVFDVKDKPAPAKRAAREATDLLAHLERRAS